MNPISDTHQQLRGHLRRWSIGILLVLGTLGLNISCGGSNNNGGTTPNPPPPPPAATASVVGTVKNGVSGQAIPGAEVTDGTITATTDTNGTYTLKKVALSDRKQITITASNYAGTQRIAHVVAGETNRVDAALLPSTITAITDLTSEVTIGLPNSPAQVVLPVDGLVTSNGGLPVFPVAASLTPIDPTSNPALMPGDYTTSAGELIESFGAMDVTFTDNSGAKLNLDAGKVAAIRIPLASAQWGGTPPATMPAFYYDSAAGRWVQEGTLTLGGTDINQYDEGTVEHFSVWNADQVTTTSYITGKVVRKNGATTVADATVTATGVDYTGTTIAISAADGTFTIPVKAGAIITLTASKDILGSPAPVLTFTTGAAGTYLPIPNSITVNSVTYNNVIVVDGFLNLVGTLRDFSPSAPYQFVAPYQMTLNNGTFDSDTAWTKGTWTISGGKANHATGTQSDLTHSVAVTSGKSYTITYTVTRSAGTVTPMLGGTSGTGRTAAGTYTETITCGSSNTNLAFRGGNTFVGTIDNVSIVLGDGHPPIFDNTGTNPPFPEYAGDPVLGPFDGPWWNPDFEAPPSGDVKGIVTVNLGQITSPYLLPPALPRLRKPVSIARPPSMPGGRISRPPTAPLMRCPIKCNTRSPFPSSSQPLIRRRIHMTIKPCIQ